MAMAFPFYMKVSSGQQGVFKGDSSNPNRRPDWIDLQDFRLDIETPRDQATGQASGKRQWKPIVIVKRWGASSPQFLQALVTNANCNVDIEFESRFTDGTEGTYYSIGLQFASVTKVRQYIGPIREQPSESAELEEIELTFQRITIQNRDGQTVQTSFFDTWME
jgi:type VI secretion system secreted protein Hcp